MAKGYHVSRRIDAPADRVWGLLTDSSSYRDWNSAVVSIEGTIALGNTISLVSIVNPKRVFTLKITDVARPNRLVWSDGMPLGLFKGERTYRLDEQERSHEVLDDRTVQRSLVGSHHQGHPRPDRLIQPVR